MAYVAIAALSIAPILGLLAKSLSFYSVPTWWPLAVVASVVWPIGRAVVIVWPERRVIGLLLIAHASICAFAAVPPFALLWIDVVESAAHWILWFGGLGVLLGTCACGYALVTALIARALATTPISERVASRGRWTIWNSLALIIGSPWMPLWLLQPPVVMWLFARTWAREMPHINAFIEAYEPLTAHA